MKNAHVNPLYIALVEDKKSDFKPNCTTDNDYDDVFVEEPYNNAYNSKGCTDLQHHDAANLGIIQNPLFALRKSQCAYSDDETGV